MTIHQRCRLWSNWMLIWICCFNLIGCNMFAIGHRFSSSFARTWYAHAKRLQGLCIRGQIVREGGLICKAVILSSIYFTPELLEGGKRGYFAGQLFKNSKKTKNAFVCERIVLSFQNWALRIRLVFELPIIIATTITLEWRCKSHPGRRWQFLNFRYTNVNVVSIIFEIQ